MKGFIEVTRTDGAKTLIAVKEIKRVEQCEDVVAIILDFNTTKKSVVNGWLFVTEAYSEIIEKLKAAE